MTIVADIIQSTGNDNSPLIIDNQPSGSILAINVFRNNIRTAIGASSPQRLFGGTFRKHRSDTLIRATCTVFGSSFSAGNCGVGLVLDDSRWDYGVAYQYDGAWVQANQTTIITGTCLWTAVDIGLHSINFGWNPVGGGANIPFNVFNPDYRDDVRNQQMISSIIVYEVYP